MSVPSTNAYDFSNTQSENYKWANDLYTFLYSNIGTWLGCDKDMVDKLMKNEYFVDYWTVAFTSSSVDKDKNYERNEFLGDRVLKGAFTEYLYIRFGPNIDQKKGTWLDNQYLSKYWQSEVTLSFGLHKHTRPPLQEDEIKPLGDIFESFLGTVVQICTTHISPGLGYVLVFNFITQLMNKITIDLNQVGRDEVSVLKELVDKIKDRNFPQPVYGKEHWSDKPEYKYRVTVNVGALRLTGYGKNPSEARNDAAKKAYNKIKEQYPDEKLEKITQTKNLQNEQNKYRKTIFNWFFNQFVENLPAADAKPIGYDVDAYKLDDGTSRATLYFKYKITTAGTGTQTITRRNWGINAVGNTESEAKINLYNKAIQNFSAQKVNNEMNYGQYLYKTLVDRGDASVAEFLKTIIDSKSRSSRTSTKSAAPSPAPSPSPATPSFKVSESSSGKPKILPSKNLNPTE